MGNALLKIKKRKLTDEEYEMLVKKIEVKADNLLEPNEIKAVSGNYHGGGGGGCQISVNLDPPTTNGCPPCF